MLIPLIIIIICIFALLFLSVFKKNIPIRLAIIFLCIGAVVGYETSGYSLSIFFDSGMICIVALEYIEIARMRSLK